MWLDILIWCFACFGMMAGLGLLGYRLLLCPHSAVGYAVLPVQGDGDGAESAVRLLLAVRRWTGAVGTIILLDRGLTAEGKTLCCLLCRDHPELLLLDDTRRIPF